MNTVGIGQQTRSIAEGEIHDILRNARRRAVLRHLMTSVGSVSLRELSVSVAEQESGESPPPTSLRASVYNSLHQTHLPKLDREGIVIYDTDRKTVVLEDRAREVDLYMEVVGPYGVTWVGFYRLLCTVGFLAVLAVELDLVGTGGVPDVLVVSLLLVVLSLASSYQLWHRRWFILRALVE